MNKTSLILIVIGVFLLLQPMNLNPFAQYITVYTSILVEKHVNPPAQAVPYNWVKTWAKTSYDKIYDKPSYFDTTQLYSPVWAGDGSYEDILQGVEKRYGYTPTLDNITKIYEDNNYIIILITSKVWSGGENINHETTSNNTNQTTSENQEIQTQSYNQILGITGFIMILAGIYLNKRRRT